MTSGGGNGAPIGVVLMSFGSAATTDDVPAYLERIRGAPAPGEVVEEMQRRYRVIGGSPLTRITREQAEALETRLNRERPGAYRVAVGMRNAPPFIAEALEELADEGVRRTVCLILSPQYSPIIMGGYLAAVDAAKESLPDDAELRVAGSWHTLPAFIDALVRRVTQALERLPSEDRDRVPVLMTAHSMPKAVVDREPGYIDMLEETARLAAERCGLADDRWRLAYQSAGHQPVEWLKPDIKDLFPGLHDAGHDRVLIVPVQFLSDHLEVLYDIDVAAAEQATEAGLALSRIETFNAWPPFIDALAAVVAREVQSAGWAPPQASLPLGETERGHMTPRYDDAIRRIDEANAVDPNTLDVGGVPRPKEAAHAEMMTRWVRALRPDANEPLLLAARAHHIRRWERPRDSFPAGREGYLRWRATLQRFHADALGEIMADVGYAAAEVKRAQDLVRKRGLGRDPDAQAMEDALCLVFMETQLADFAGQLDDDARMVEVLASTWRKMSPQGRAAAQALALEDRAARLLDDAAQAAEPETRRPSTGETVA